MSNEEVNMSGSQNDITDIGTNPMEMVSSIYTDSKEISNEKIESKKHSEDIFLYGSDCAV